MAVEAQKRDPVARLHSGFPKNSSQTARPFGKLRVSEALVSTDNSRLARVLLFGVTQEANWSERNIHDEASPTRLTDLHPLPKRGQ